jgi:hypothetical protein
MAMRIHVAVSAFLFVSLGIPAPWGSEGRAIADGACVEQPGRDAPIGERWYYHFDREKNRKCWHRGPVVPLSRVTLPIARTERAVGSTLNSMFGPMVRGIRTWLRQPMPHERVAGEPRIVQSDATKPLTIEDIAQQPGFPEERAEPRPVTSLTQAQRRVLYEEFLRWEALQRRSGGSTVPGQAR